MFSFNSKVVVFVFTCKVLVLDLPASSFVLMLVHIFIFINLLYVSRAITARFLYWVILYMCV